MFSCECCKIFKKTYFEEVLESVIDKLRWWSCVAVIQNEDEASMNSSSVIVDDEVSICSDTAASYIHKALQARDKEKCIHAFYYSRIGPSHGYIQHYVKVIFDCKINSYDQNCFSKCYKDLAIIKQRSICERMIGDARGGGQK